MARYTRTPITQLSSNESAAIQQINKNLEDIQNAIQDTVSRSGQSPTQMTSNLDLNGKRIINAPAPLTDNDLVRRVDVVEDMAAVQSLVNAASTAAGQAIAAAEGVQEAIADAHVGIVADDLMLGDDSKIRIAANNIDDISACVNDIEDIKAVGDNISNVNAVADNETNINAVNSNKTNIDTVAGNDNDISTVAGIASKVSTVADNVSDIGTVATNMSDINDCADNMPSITGASTQAANAAASAQAASSSAEQAAISAAGTHFKLFHHDWFDYELNDMAWLRADTFSWQDGTVYSNAYNHLVADYNGGTSQTETVGSYTITYVLATDGHKITTDETNVANIYNESGVAWYYILDTTNQRFKLPRENPAREVLGQSAPVIGNGISLGLDDGTSKLGLTGKQNNLNFLAGNLGAYGVNVGAGYTKATANVLDKGIGITTDSTKSGMIAKLSETTGVYKGKQYLYFYVGQFSQSATEQTAGLNTELFNGKMDLDLGNATQVTKDTIVGWAMPDYSAAVDAGTGHTSYANAYVVPNTGFVSIRLTLSTTSGDILVNNVIVASGGFSGTGGLNIGSLIPVSKNDKIHVDNNYASMKFYPLKGISNA